MDTGPCINYMLTLAQHVVGQQMALRLEAYGITPGQYNALNYLWGRGAVNPKDIAQALALDTSTMSGVLNQLQKKGLIDRQIDHHDRRKVNIVLTKAGDAIQDHVCDIVRQIDHMVLRSIPLQSRETFLDSLRQLSQH